jgi:hypothetical protein
VISGPNEGAFAAIRLISLRNPGVAEALRRRA